MHRPFVALCAVSLLTTGANTPLRQHAPAQLQLTVATIHAAALTTSRASTDSLDQPYLLVSRLGPGTATGITRLPATSHLSIRQDQALGAQPLLTLGLEPGDSVHLLLSLLESPEVQLPTEERVAQASAATLAEAGALRADHLAASLGPVTGAGAHWLGSVTVVLTNEGGTLRWRHFECVAACKVLAAPMTPDILDPPAPATGGVVELTGAGGTYHLNLRSQRVP